MLEFNASKNCTLGIELELQIIDAQTRDLTPRAGDILQSLTPSPGCSQIKPEMTQSMLEINSNAHTHPDQLLKDLKNIKTNLLQQTQDFNIHFSGGGTHPLQLWNERKIFPQTTFQEAANKYGHLAKMFTVFGLHIHIGCSDADLAIYSLQALMRYMPHFIALSASSPFCQGIDTLFDSSRSTVAPAFPLSGFPPMMTSWAEFNEYLAQLQQLKIVEKIENFYWDIRPCPQFGTLEIRVCDAPLTLEKVALLAAYAQMLLHYIYTEKPALAPHDRYNLHRYNSFQASRHGLQADYIDFIQLTRKPLQQEILEVCARLQPHAAILQTSDYLAEIIELVQTKQNDATWLRSLYRQGKSLTEIINLQSQYWSLNSKIKHPLLNSAATNVS